MPTKSPIEPRRRGAAARGKPVEERLMATHEVTAAGCMAWTGHVHRSGYALLDSDVIRELLAEARDTGHLAGYDQATAEHRAQREAAAQSAAEHACGAPCTSEGERRRV